MNSILPVVFISLSLSCPISATQVFATFVNQSAFDFSIVEETDSEIVPMKLNDVVSNISNSSVFPSLPNMINYNLQTQVSIGEHFNPDSYPQRPSLVPDSMIYEPVSGGDTFAGNVNLQFGPSPKNPDSIIGNDGRTLVSNPKTWPYFPTAFIVSRFYVFNNETSQYGYRVCMGTGFLIGKNALATAAHCVAVDASSTYYDENNVPHYEYENNTHDPQFPYSVEIFCGLANSVEYMFYGHHYDYYSSALALDININYALSQDADYDWAVLELDRNIGNTTGYYLCNTGLYDEEAGVFSYGYPSDLNKQMVETYGDVVGENQFSYYYDLDTMSGQSGSPVFTYGQYEDFFVCAIHNVGGTTYNSGVKINNFIWHYIHSFNTSYNWPS